MKDKNNIIFLTSLILATYLVGSEMTYANELFNFSEVDISKFPSFENIKDQVPSDININDIDFDKINQNEINLEEILKDNNLEQIIDQNITNNIINHFNSASDIKNSPFYNSSVLVSPIAAQVGTYFNMLETYNNAFSQMDTFVIIPKTARELSNVEEKSGVWIRPYTSYDSVNLINGPRAHSTTYGTFIGGDSNVKTLNSGGKIVFSPYISYQGNRIGYDNNTIFQNGGTLGFLGTYHKGSFFAGLTTALGANVTEIQTPFANENFPMITAGVAGKTGYNYEFKDGKYILQPSFMMSYTMVNAFDNSDFYGMEFNSNTLHSIQLSPQLKFVMNTKTGWQPYLMVNMNWNLLDKAHVNINNIALDDMSVGPYVQYGGGIQKTIKDKLSLFIQIAIRNGSRTGLSANGGIKIFFGKKKKK